MSTDKYTAHRTLPFLTVAAALGWDVSKFKTRKAGQEHFGPCHLHGSKSNQTCFSYHVDGKFRCFSCPAKGSGAINLVLYRLQKTFEGELAPIAITGLPSDLSAARRLAEIDRYTFQVWSLGLVGLQATPKGSDRGIDGVGFFKDDKSGQHKKVLCQVKSGHVKSGDIRDFVGTMGREKADIGVFICLSAPTRDMKVEAASAGLYGSATSLDTKKVPRVQILTIEDLLEGRGIQFPSQIVEATHAKAQRQIKRKPAEQGSLSLDDDSPF